MARFPLSVESVPAEQRDALLVAKAQALHDMACTIQDDLGALGIYYGDEPLLRAKVRIDEACQAARRVAGRVRHNEKVRSRALQVIAAREA